MLNQSICKVTGLLIIHLQFRKLIVLECGPKCFDMHETEGEKRTRQNEICSGLCTKFVYKEEKLFKLNAEN